MAGEIKEPKEFLWKKYYSWASKRKKKFTKFLFEVMVPLIFILLIVVGSILLVPILKDARLFNIDKNLIKSGDFILLSTSPMEIKEKKEVLYEYKVTSKLRIDKLSVVNEIIVNNLPPDCVLENYKKNDNIGEGYDKLYTFAILCNNTLIPEDIGIKVEFKCIYNKLDWDNLTLCKELEIL